MRVLGFGTYDGSKQPRVNVLMEGLTARGLEVSALNRPLGFSTNERVQMLHRPWLAYRLLVRLMVRWIELTFARARLPEKPDVVVVGYLAQFDVFLARVLFPSAVLVMDMLVFADDTALDRGLRRGVRTRLLAMLDRAAIRLSDVVVVDTKANLELIPRAGRAKGVIVPVGASSEWFDPLPRSAGEGPLKVVFFGLFTPLQGAPVIGAALAQLPPDVSIDVTMVGTGQDYNETRALVGNDPRITWVPWVDSHHLPEFVAAHDVCLGIFGDAPKAHRVVPTKVYQGSAAGCAIITSDTPPQRELLDGAAVLVPPNDPAALCAVLGELAVGRRGHVNELQRRARDLAARRFRARQVVEPLVLVLDRVSDAL